MCERGRPQLQGVQCRVGRDAHLTDRACLLRVEFLGEISSFLHSRALLPRCPPTPCSPEERRGSLGRPEAQNERRNAGAFHKTYPCMRRSRSLFFAWMLEYGL